MAVSIGLLLGVVASVSDRLDDLTVDPVRVPSLDRA